MSWAQPAAAGGVTNEIRIAELQGAVEVSPSGATTWVLTQTNQILHWFDRLRTGPNSRVALRWSDQSVVPLGAWTEIEILPPHSPGAQAGLHLVRGVISFFHRDKPGRIRVITRGAVAGVEGTEFVLAVSEVNNSETTTLSVIDGKVQFGNDQGTLLLTNGQQAVVEAGKAPVRTAGFIANNILQWCFYYPAVLDLGDLPLASGEQEILRESIAAYRAGDLQVALAKYSATRQPASEAERVYYAALLLSVGEVGKAESEMASLSATDVSARPQRLAKALRQLIAAVKRQPGSSTSEPQLATEFLANSYHEQSRAVANASLKTALHYAKQAVTNSPGFGFAWARVAELEFSFGHTSSAMEALDKSLSLSPRNAQALVLKGFLLAARNRTREATAWFEQALAADSSLGNAWLGRGLCRIRRGDAIGGREDLLVAAALEPQRAELRSYLGKAYASAGDSQHAAKELQLAKGLDPNDPTAWLYSALLNQQDNRINDAVRDLEKSQDLNDNRRVYRSKLLLDQDHAVRSANLAGIYRDAGMFDVSLREAARAVNYDYANYSAHLFLANSYEGLRQPNQFNSRYESSALSEYLLANLLAPASAGTLSPIIEPRNYSLLFERDRLGVVSITEYLSRGAWKQSGVQFGTFGNLSYGFEAVYRSDPGERANNDIESRQLTLRLKQQLTPQDSVYVEVQHYEAESGDTFQYYDPNTASRTARFKEDQEPFLAVGYHHEWSPGVHTLFLMSRLEGDYSLTAAAVPTLLAGRPAIDPDVPEITHLTSVIPLTMQEKYKNSFSIYSGELQQIWQQPSHNTVIGGRFQYGCFDTFNFQKLPSTFGAVFDEPAAQQNLNSSSKRMSIYGYHQWQIVEPLQLIGGLSYDWLAFPENLLSFPVSTREERVEQISPKAGIIWTPTKDTTVRFAYTRSLGSQNLDQSLQLEQSQVAGFGQSFRSIISEPGVAHTGAAQFETFDLSLEQRFETGTYLGISGEILKSRFKQTVGAFDGLPDLFDFAIPSGLREHLDYQEESLVFTVNQLLGRQWALGAQYRLSYADLRDTFPEAIGIPVPTGFDPQRRLEGTLNSLHLFGIFNHSSGFFAKGEGLWYAQNNRGYAPALPGDDFWQFNAFVGYRSPRRRAEAMIGLLNIADQDYQLNPLNIYSELPHERTLAVRFQLSF